MKMMKYALLPLLLSASMQVLAASVPVTSAISGDLLGFKNVTISTGLYNVTFEGGIFADNFGATGENLFFTTESGARAASTALLDAFQQHQQWDTHTGDATSLSRDSIQWFIHTPFMLGVDQNEGASRDVSVSETPDEFADYVIKFPTNVGLGQDLSLNDNNAWAVWQLASPAAVPVPAAFWLFGSGLIGLVGLASARPERGICCKQN